MELEGQNDKFKTFILPNMLARSQLLGIIDGAYFEYAFPNCLTNLGGGKTLAVFDFEVPIGSPCCYCYVSNTDLSFFQRTHLPISPPRVDSSKVDHHPTH